MKLMDGPLERCFENDEFQVEEIKENIGVEPNWPVKMRMQDALE